MSELDFSPSVRKKSGAHCRQCMRSYDRRWAGENREKTSAATRRSRVKRLLKKYNAPITDLDAVLDAQGGVCLCCGGPAGTREFHVDHDHVTDEFRGMSCHGCNVGLGAFNDDVERLRMAIQYLQAKSWEERIQNLKARNR